MRVMLRNRFANNTMLYLKLRVLQLKCLLNENFDFRREENC